MSCFWIQDNNQVWTHESLYNFSFELYRKKPENPNQHYLRQGEVDNITQA